LNNDRNAHQTNLLKYYHFPNMKSIALTALVLLAAIVPLSSQQTPASGSAIYNPTPKACCPCHTFSVYGVVDQPDSGLKRIKPNADGSYDAEVRVKLASGANCTEDSYTISISAAVVSEGKIIYTENKSTIIGINGAGASTNKTVKFTIPADTARAGDTWKFSTICVGTGDNSTPPTKPDQFEQKPGCETIEVALGGCDGCASGSCSDSASQSSFSLSMHTSKSLGGMTAGFLDYYTADFSNPGRAALMANVPSNFIVTRVGGLITSINTGSGIIEVAAADAALLAQDPNAFTVTHKDPSGNVFRTTTISMVTEGGVQRLRADGTFDGATTRYEQTQPELGTLILEQGRVVGGDFQSLSKEELIKTESTPGIRVHRRKLSERATHTAAWAIVSDTESTWEKQSTGWVQTKEIIDPAGAALTTTWSYYQPGDVTGPNGATQGLGLVKQITRYDGTTSFHTYSLFESTATTPFADNPAGKVRTSTWDPVTQTETNTTAINGTIVAKSTRAHTPTSETNTTYTSATGTLTTVTHYVPSGQDFGGKPIRTIHPDGTLTTHTYTRETGGGYTTVTDHGSTTDNTTVTKGTRTTTTVNSRGTTILSKTEAIGYDTGSAIFSSMAVTAVDNLGRALTTAHHPTSLVAAGEQATASGAAYTTSTEYSCCGVAKETDMQGIPTFYAYDHLQRQVKTNRLGVTMETVHKGLTTETHRYPEAVTTSLSPALAGTTATLISKNVSNLSGTLQESWSPDPTSNTPGALLKQNSTLTTYQPAAGLSTRTVTTTVDGFTQTTDTYLDGKTHKTTGDLSPHMQYAYSVNETGELHARAYLDGVTHREIIATQSDWAGRTIASASLPTLTSLITDHLALSTSEYNSSGQMVKSTDPDGVVTLMAYNSLGEQTITAIDLNRNNQIDYGSDTVTGSEQNYLASYTYTSSVTLPALHTTSKVWQPAAEEGSPTITGHSYRAPNGLYAAATQLGVANASLQQTTLSGNGNWTTTSTAPDGTQQRQTYTAGRLTSSSTLLTDHSTLLTSTSYTYDSLNRPLGTTDSRTGTTTNNYLSTTADIVASVTDPGNRTTAFTYDTRGRQIKTDAPNTTVIDQNGNTQTSQNETFTSYHPDGSARAQWGDQTNPTYREYDYADRLIKLHTWQTPVTLTNTTATPPAGSAITTWLYDGKRGWLNEKNYHGETDNGTADADYTYTDAGRLKTRTWERGVTTTYDYDNGGRQTHTTYSNETNGHTTPNVVIQYDSLGRPKNQTNGLATTIYDYEPTTLALDKETITYNIPGQSAFTRVIDHKQDTLQRSSGYQLKNGTTFEQTVTYTYNPTNGRFATVTGVTSPATGSPASAGFTYGYTANSNLIATVTGPAHQVTNTFEANRDVLLTKANTRANDNSTISNISYIVNNIGQRTNATRSGAATNSTTWAYDALGQVISADDSNNTFDRSYQYDGIGNRQKSADSLTLPTTNNYNANALNQYTQITSDQLTSEPTYDTDGNATAYPVPAYATANSTLVWDAENRMISATVNSVTTNYYYDAQSRRIAHNTGSTTTLYVYDAWNCIAEYQTSDFETFDRKTLVWGPDLSGSMQGAGGVGGLLAVTQIPVTSAPVTYYPIYDGNGNVTEYIDSSATILVHFDYDPFGNITNPITNNSVTDNLNYRFSTKPLDSATGLYYYGYRYYDPVTGRWPSKDPIEERGGVNLYGFVGNDGIGRLDFLGLVRADMDYYWGPPSLATPWPYSKPIFKIRAWNDYDTVKYVNGRLYFMGGNWDRGLEVFTEKKEFWEVHNTGNLQKEYLNIDKTEPTLDRWKEKGVSIGGITMSNLYPESSNVNCVHCMVWDATVSHTSVQDQLGIGFAAISDLLPYGGSTATEILKSILQPLIDNKQLRIRLTICADEKRQVALLNLPVAGVVGGQYGQSLGSWIHSNPGGASGLLGGDHYTKDFINNTNVYGWVKHQSGDPNRVYIKED
jgi:RHS repeat-associated protein